MPTTTDRCTCPTASAVCDGPQPDCPVHGYADAIMSAGQYVDRRGRRWHLCPAKRWKHAADIHPAFGVLYDTLTPAQMRLMIERDQHRSVCPGLRDCDDHPVPVVIDWTQRIGYPCFGAHWVDRSVYVPTLPRAYSAALQLALDREAETPSDGGSGLDREGYRNPVNPGKSLKSGACSYETDTKASTKKTAFHVPLTCKETGKILTGEKR